MNEWLNPQDAEPGIDGPHAVDRHVGLRIRMRRKEVGMSQEALAAALNLTFQQVQKYERATNRVSASKLWEIARALHTPVSYFYEGLEQAAPAATTPAAEAVHRFILTPEGMELATTYPQLAPAPRRKVLELVRAMVEDDR